MEHFVFVIIEERIVVMDTVEVTIGFPVGAYSDIYNAELNRIRKGDELTSERNALRRDPTVDHRVGGWHNMDLDKHNRLRQLDMIVGYRIERIPFNPETA